MLALLETLHHIANLLLAKGVRSIGTLKVMSPGYVVMEFRHRSQSDTTKDDVDVIAAGLNPLQSLSSAQRDETRRWEIIAS